MDAQVLDESKHNVRLPVGGPARALYAAPADAVGQLSVRKTAALDPGSAGEAYADAH